MTSQFRGSNDYQLLNSLRLCDHKESGVDPSRMKPSVNIWPASGFNLPFQIGAGMCMNRMYATINENKNTKLSNYGPRTGGIATSSSGGTQNLFLFSKCNFDNVKLFKFAGVDRSGPSLLNSDLFGSYWRLFDMDLFGRQTTVGSSRYWQYWSALIALIKGKPSLLNRGYSINPESTDLMGIDVDQNEDFYHFASTFDRLSSGNCLHLLQCDEIRAHRQSSPFFPFLKNSGIDSQGVSHIVDMWANMINHSEYAPLVYFPLRESTIPIYTASLGSSFDNIYYDDKYKYPPDSSIYSYLHNDSTWVRTFNRTCSYMDPDTDPSEIPDYKTPMDPKYSSSVCRASSSIPIYVPGVNLDFGKFLRYNSDIPSNPICPSSCVEVIHRGQEDGGEGANSPAILFSKIFDCIMENCNHQEIISRFLADPVHIDYVGFRPFNVLPEYKANLSSIQPRITADLSSLLSSSTAYSYQLDNSNMLKMYTTIRDKLKTTGCLIFDLFSIASPVRTLLLKVDRNSLIEEPIMNSDNTTWNKNIFIPGTKVGAGYGCYSSNIVNHLQRDMFPMIGDKGEELDYKSEKNYCYVGHMKNLRELAIEGDIDAKDALTHLNRGYFLTNNKYTRWMLQGLIKVTRGKEKYNINNQYGSKSLMTSLSSFLLIAPYRTGLSTDPVTKNTFDITSFSGLELITNALGDDFNDHLKYDVDENNTFQFWNCMNTNYAVIYRHLSSDHKTIAKYR